MANPDQPNSPEKQEDKANKPKSILSEIDGFLKDSLYSLLPKQWSQFLKKIESYFAKATAAKAEPNDPIAEKKSTQKHAHKQEATTAKESNEITFVNSTPNPNLNTINQQQSINKDIEDISGKKTLLIGEKDPNNVLRTTIHFHGAPNQITDEKYFNSLQKNPPSLKPNQTNLYPANSLTLKSQSFTKYIESTKAKFPNATIELTAHSYGGQTLLTFNKEAILNLKPSKLTLSDPVIYPENLETLTQLINNGTEIALSYGNTKSTSKDNTIPNFCQTLKDKYPDSELIMSGKKIVGLKSVNPKIYIIENSQTPYKNHEQAKNNIAFLQNELDKPA